MMFFSHLYLAVIPDMMPGFRGQGRQRNAPWLQLKELCGRAPVQTYKNRQSVTDAGFLYIMVCRFAFMNDTFIDSHDQIDNRTKHI